MYREKGNHIITCVTEHKAVIDTCKRLEKEGYRVTYLAVLAILAQLLLVPRIGIVWAVLCVVIIHMLCVPVIFRYSRVIWAHLNVATKP